MIIFLLCYVDSGKNARNCLFVELLEDSAQRRFPSFDDIDRHSIAF